MNIVHTIFSMATHTGGPAVFLRDLSMAQAAAGAQVAIVTAGHQHEARTLPDSDRVRTHVLPRVPVAYLPPARLGGKVSGLLRPADSILHDHGIWLPSNRIATRSARRAGRPYVVSPHGSLNGWAAAWRAGRKRLAWSLYQRRILGDADAIVATSAEEMAAVRARIPAARIALIPNGVHVPATVPDRSHLVDRPHKTLLFMSRLHPKKNVPGLIEAWHRLAGDPRFGHWTLTIAGPDELDERRAAAALAARLGVANSVQFLDTVAESEKADLFAQADLFVLPSFSENFGIVVTEALGHGVPVITTHATPWEALPRLGMGWQVAPTATALAGALDAAMSLSDTERLAMGQRGHAHVVTHYGWKRITDMTLALYDWLLGGTKRPDFVHV